VPAPMRVCDARGFGVDESAVFQVSLSNICLRLESVCRWPGCPVAEGQARGFGPVGEVIAAVVEGYLVPSLSWKGLRSSRCSEGRSAAADRGVYSSGWSAAACRGVRRLRAVCITGSCAAARACGFGVGSLVGVTAHVVGVWGTWSL
jgi:hypothetical protein